MKKLLLLVAAAALMFTGCSKPRMHVDPSWTDVPQKITVLVTPPYVKNTDDMYDDFLGESEFNDWFVEFVDFSFSEHSASKAKVQYVDEKIFDMTEMTLGNKRVRFPLPNTDKIEGLSGIVVSIHPTTFWRQTVTVYNAYGYTSHTSLDGDLKYSIVNADDHKVLAYGLAKDRSSFAFAMTKSNWEALAEALVRKVVQKTPLQK